MKVITIHQPWAEAIRLGLKRWETRSWRTRYRGWIGIHASQRDPDTQTDAFTRGAMAAMPHGNGLPRGGIVAVAWLNACLLIRDGLDNEGPMRQIINAGGGELTEANDNENNPGRGQFMLSDMSDQYVWGDWTPSGWSRDAARYAWELVEIRPRRVPYPIRGQQGLWQVSRNIQAEIMADMLPPIPNT